jgi:C_GCAxxG_C_C family probable redox protein
MRAHSRDDAMRSIEEGQAYALDCFTKGCNCAESVLRGTCHAQGLDIPDACLRMATPFGGGIGRSEDVCGAPTGGVMAIGACLGRTCPDGDKRRSYDAANRFFKDFVQALGSARCGVLNKGDFGSPEHRARCGGFAQEATRLATLAIRNDTA